LLIINLTKAASTDGPFGLLTVCPIFNIEVTYYGVLLLANKMLSCLLADRQTMPYSIPFAWFMMWWLIWC